jgi:hypothetical protein
MKMEGGRRELARAGIKRHLPESVALPAGRAVGCNETFELPPFEDQSIAKSMNTPCRMQEKHTQANFVDHCD